MSCVGPSQCPITLGSRAEAQHSGVLRQGSIWAFVTCEPRTLHPLRKVHSRALQHMSAVFVPGPQAFVAAASDTRALAKNFGSTPGAAPCSTNIKITACFGAETTSSLSSVPHNREHQSAAPLANAHSTVLCKPSSTMISTLDLAHAARGTSCCGQRHHQLASTKRRRELRESNFFWWRGRVRTVPRNAMEPCRGCEAV